MSQSLLPPVKKSTVPRNARGGITGSMTMPRARATSSTMYDSPKVVNIIEGKRGPSAYELALKNGFVGTEQEWLTWVSQSAAMQPSGLDIRLVFENGLI